MSRLAASRRKRPWDARQCYRGSYASSYALAAALGTIAAHPDPLEFSGFMGYDAHIMKLPDFLAS